MDFEGLCQKRGLLLLMLRVLVKIVILQSIHQIRDARLLLMVGLVVATPDKMRRISMIFSISKR
jgi:hypothetical protein